MQNAMKVKLKMIQLIEKLFWSCLMKVKKYQLTKIYEYMYLLEIAFGLFDLIYHVAWLDGH